MDQDIIAGHINYDSKYVSLVIW